MSPPLMIAAVIVAGVVGIACLPWTERAVDATCSGLRVLWLRFVRCVILWWWMP